MHKKHEVMCLKIQRITKCHCGDSAPRPDALVGMNGGLGQNKK